MFRGEHDAGGGGAVHRDSWARTMTRSSIAECTLLVWIRFYEPGREVGPDRPAGLKRDLDRFPTFAPSWVAYGSGFDGTRRLRLKVNRRAASDELPYLPGDCAAAAAGLAAAGATKESAKASAMV